MFFTYGRCVRLQVQGTEQFCSVVSCWLRRKPSAIFPSCPCSPKQIEVKARGRHSCHSACCQEWPQLCRFCTKRLLCSIWAYLDLNHPFMQTWVIFLPAAPAAAAAGRQGRSLSALLQSEFEHCVQTCCVRSHTNTHWKKWCLHTHTHRSHK